MMAYNDVIKQQSVVLFCNLISTELNVKMIDGGILTF